MTTSTGRNLQNMNERCLQLLTQEKQREVPPVTVELDYRGIEMRIAAHFIPVACLCGCQDWEKNRLSDPLVKAAAEHFGVTPKAVTPVMRAQAKWWNTYTVYGVNPRK